MTDTTETAVPYPPTVRRWPVPVAAAMGTWGLLILIPHLTAWSDPLVRASRLTVDVGFGVAVATLFAVFASVVGMAAPKPGACDGHRGIGGAFLPALAFVVGFGCFMSWGLAMLGNEDTRKAVAVLRSGRPITVSTIADPDGSTRWVRIVMPVAAPVERISLGGAPLDVVRSGDGLVVDLRPDRAVALAAALAVRVGDPAAASLSKLSVAAATTPR